MQGVIHNAVLELSFSSLPFEHAEFSSAQMGEFLTNPLVAQDIPQDAPVLDVSQRQSLVVAAQTKEPGTRNRGMCSFCHLFPLTDDVIFSLPAPNSSFASFDFAWS